MRKARLFEIGAITVAVGAITSVIAGIAEVGYIQCIANGGSACTGAGSTQYITVFLANSDMLSVGISVALIGAIVMIGGAISGSVAKLGEELKASMAPTRLCPKCGTQVGLTTKFCPNCGTNLSA